MSKSPIPSFKYSGDNQSSQSISQVYLRDLLSGLIVFLVALPLCLGIALASGAPLFSGILSGVIGGVVVGLLSGSKTSVSGPAAGLTAIVAAQIERLGAFETFLLAVLFAGILQILLGAVRAGSLSSYFPTSVIQGLLAAIGVILILKQLPHLLGHDTDPEGEMAFDQPDHENTFTEIGKLFTGEIHQGAIVVGIVSLGFLLCWDRFKKLKGSPIPAPLLVVLFGIAMKFVLDRLEGAWAIEESHLVQVPVADDFAQLTGFLKAPDWSQWSNTSVYIAGGIICLVATLETLLNLEAVDKLDPRQRVSPSNRELIAQGVGNILCGLTGGIPLTSVIVRSSVNINAGATTKLSAVFHGILLAVCVLAIPSWLNEIPLAALAAILLHTGLKLVHPKLITRMWKDGIYQFIPFIATLVGIVFTDLIIGVTIGLVISLAYILVSNMKQPVSIVQEQRFGEQITHVQLANQVSFLNRASLQEILDATPSGSHLVFDAKNSNFIDPDILAMLREFRELTSPTRSIKVSMIGFQERMNIEDQILYEEYSTKELQQRLSPDEVIEILLAGNQRFRTGQRLVRDLNYQIGEASTGQFPLAIILGCIDSRAPAEIVFDVGLGEVFSTRIAGNVVRAKVLGSLEYACAVAGAKVILVMGHTLCGAVSTAVNLAARDEHSCANLGCEHLDLIIDAIQDSIDKEEIRRWDEKSEKDRQAIIDSVARRNAIQSANRIYSDSSTLRSLADSGKIAIVASIYNLENGGLEILSKLGKETSDAVQ
jgi:carbonic anhydrase